MRGVFSRVVTINIENNKAMLASEAESVIATIKEDFRPRHVFNQLIECNKDSGVWLMMPVKPNGEVAVYRMRHADTFIGASCFASATYVAQ